MSNLSGKMILLLRSSEDADSSTEKIRQTGAYPILCPMIQIKPPENPESLDPYVLQSGQYDWVCFTSIHAVHALAQRLEAVQGTSHWKSRARIAVIGPATLEAVQALNWEADFVAQKATAEDFLAEFAQIHEIRNRKFLLPLSSIARRTPAGWTVSPGRHR